MLNPGDHAAEAPTIPLMLSLRAAPSRESGLDQQSVTALHEGSRRPKSAIKPTIHNNQPSPLPSSRAPQDRFPKVYSPPTPHSFPLRHRPSPFPSHTEPSPSRPSSPTTPRKAPPYRHPIRRRSAPPKSAPGRLAACRDPARCGVARRLGGAIHRGGQAGGRGRRR